MSRDDLLYLVHMLETSEKAVEKTQGLSRHAYDADENLRLALAHLVQIIGEAARRVTSQTCVAHPEIPWREIIGMRHRIVHDYMRVDEDILWVVVTEDLPPLIAALQKIVPGEETG
jgi:uncharacterized protein with HEPN domain